jgi:hypothetical protein
MMIRSRLPLPLRQLPALAIASAIVIAAAPSASAATVDVQEALSQNWSGYTAGSADGSTQFSSVSASWVQPAAKCTSDQRYAAFWVGLGGAGQQSESLEQIGTQADCVGGEAQYNAWYELVPAAQVKLGLAIHAGDQISAKVTVSGSNVTVALSDQTTGNSVNKALQMSNPDTSSAEWIAEAPSTCDGSGNCQPLPLADFGTVKFTDASATADGHTGSISDPSWTPEAVQLSGGAGDSGYAPTALASDQSSDSAQPSALSPDGSSFSVAASLGGSQSSSSDPSGSASGGDPGDGAYGYGGDPGGGGYGGSGGDGYGSGGYGSGGYGSGGYGSGGYGSGGNGSGGYGAGGWYPGA